MQNFTYKVLEIFLYSLEGLLKITRQKILLFKKYKYLESISLLFKNHMIIIYVNLF